MHAVKKNYMKKHAGENDMQVHAGENTCVYMQTGRLPP